MNLFQTIIIISELVTEIKPCFTLIYYSDINYFMKSSIELHLKKVVSAAFIVLRICNISKYPKRYHVLTYIYNSVLLTTYSPTFWKFSILLMIPEPHKNPHLPSFYHPSLPSPNNGESTTENATQETPLSNS